MGSLQEIRYSTYKSSVLARHVGCCAKLFATGRVVRRAVQLHWKNSSGQRQHSFQRLARVRHTCPGRISSTRLQAVRESKSAGNCSRPNSNRSSTSRTKLVSPGGAEDSSDNSDSNDNNRLESQLAIK